MVCYGIIVIHTGSTGKQLSWLYAEKPKSSLTVLYLFYLFKYVKKKTPKWTN